MATSTATGATSTRRVKLPPQLQQVEDLLLWHDVLRSAAVLGAATVLYALLELSGVPLLTWISNLGLITVAGTFLWAAGARIANVTGPVEHLPAVLKTGFDEATVNAAAERARQLTNRGLARAGNILGGSDLTASAKAFGALWLVGWVGRMITPVGLLYGVVLVLFVAPKVYELRKDEIDSAVGSGRAAVDQHLGQAKAKAKELIQRLTPQKAPRPASKDE